MAVKFGFSLPIFAGAGDHHPRTPLLEHVDIGHLMHAVQEAEALGYDSIWVADHLILGKGGWILECWTLLSALSQATSRLRLGTIHLANLFRHPSITAKMAATLDVLSNGRVDFFFEAGHRGSRGEVAAYGLAWYDDQERLERFEEAVRMAKALWTQDSVTFHGKYFHLENAICAPRPVQKPTIPMWIGTLGGESLSANIGMDDKMVDVIARHADWWNNTPASVEACQRVLSMLRQACQRNGTSYQRIGKSLENQIMVAETQEQVRRLQEAIHRLNPQRKFYQDWEQLRQRYIIGTVDEVRQRLEEYVSIGIEYFMFWFMDYPSLDGLRLFARKVMPHFR